MACLIALYMIRGLSKLGRFLISFTHVCWGSCVIFLSRITTFPTFITLTVLADSERISLNLFFFIFLVTVFHVIFMFCMEYFPWNEIPKIN